MYKIFNVCVSALFLSISVLFAQNIKINIWHFWTFTTTYMLVMVQEISLGLRFDVQFFFKFFLVV